MKTSRSIVRCGVEVVYSDQMNWATSRTEAFGLRVWGPEERVGAAAAGWRFGGILKEGDRWVGV